MIVKRLLILIILLFISVACSSAQPIEEDGVEVVETEIEEMEEETAVSSTNIPESTPTNVPSSISDEDATSLMNALAFSSDEEALEALTVIVDANDQRFIPVLIELFRAAQVGIVRSLQLDEYVLALESLSGQDIGPSWGGWIEWYGGTDIVPPDGFVTWKGRILSLIDVNFGEFLQDSYPSTIRVEEIAWGGVVVDGIPALDNPTMLAAADADYLEPWDAVFGIELNGDARAYPLRILDWHEMANDVVGGVPVSLAYCTLCGAAIAYNGRLSDDVTFTFGSSGFLYRSNKLMYDRQTRTLWNQLTGKPVLGNLVDDNITLDLLPVVLTTWDEWQLQHPDTVVVDVDTGFGRQYEPGAAYAGYFAAEDTMFPVWQRSDARATKDQIYALNLNDTPKAYPLDLLTEAGVTNDTLADVPLVLVASRGIVTVDGISRRSGPARYSAGAEVRVYNRGDHTFSPSDAPDTVVDEAGNVWTVTEEALISPNGETAERINGHLAYWFGWFAFYPETLLHE